MKIIICGSISAAKEIEDARDQLVATGHEVEIPEGVKHLKEWQDPSATTEEKAERKIKNDLIRGYYEKMKGYDVVLVVNSPKKGIDGYIGGNTLIEMAFAHILNKKLYILNPLPELSYTSEMIAMQPIILNGDLSQIVYLEITDKV
ncbi:MAG: hypothetical protein V4469_02715 [Patescibacteria group bacterium]